MITKYVDFILENLYKPKEKPENVYGIKKYTFREDGKLDVHQDVYISRTFTKLPIEFGIITGDFYIEKCENLTTLEGLPEMVTGDMGISSNRKITDLKYCTPTVGGNFYCSSNKNLTSIEDGPTSVKGSYKCNNNKSLTSLKGVPSIINGIFTISSSPKLESMDYFPKEVYGQVNLYNIKPTRYRGRPRILDKYPVSILHKKILNAPPLFNIVQDLILQNIELFKPLLDNKIAFHQQIIRLAPSLSEYYRVIPAPSKKTIL